MSSDAMNPPVDYASSSTPNTPQSRKAVAIGMRLLLASLTMIFLAGITLYILLRFGVFGSNVHTSMNLPIGIWFSTLVLLAGSVTIHLAVNAIRFERIAKFRVFLLTTLVLALLFLCIQFPCLWLILADHQRQAPGHGLYGLVFCLILLHALHVIGGVISMIIVTLRAMHDRYDHENYLGVKYAAAYWHFLDIVWLTMFGMFLFLG